MALAPGLLVSAPRSGAGKTTVTLGLQRALRRRGLRVRGAKAGPDYIDPAFHAAACGAPSVNLDSFAMAPDLLGALAARTATDADIVVSEGAMGLFDGLGEGVGSSAAVAAAVGWPVLLVVDVSGASQTAAAVAHGCASFDPKVRIGGVILNRVASERHRRLVEQGFARLALPILGALGRDDGLTLPERHLGLVQAEETDELDARLDRLADAVAAAVDLDAVVAMAAPTRAGRGVLPRPPAQRIAVARDAAFSFLYPHLLAGWRDHGAEIRFFSPLGDEAPPADCDACWLPGGYPELHAGRLAAMTRFQAGLKAFAAGKPVHGECGGYMVLGRGIEDADGMRHAMAGLLPVETSFARRRLHLGYRQARLRSTSLLGAAGTCLRGHEFHYAAVIGGAPTEADALAEVSNGEGRPLGLAGHRIGRVSGSFFHMIA